MTDSKHRYQIQEEDGKYLVYDTWYNPLEDVGEEELFILDIYHCRLCAEERCDQLNRQPGSTYATG